jgi:Xaa-Pro aminopeptidase
MPVRKLLPVLILLSLSAAALDRQPNADYRARRVALAEKTKGGVVVMFAATEAEGPNAIYGFRQDDNFFYLTGWTAPGAALLIAPAAEATPTAPARPYTEILFLPTRNLVQERWTGAKLGPENADAPRQTGFDKVESLDKLRDELAQALARPGTGVYSDVPRYGETSPAASPLEWLRRTNAFPGFGFVQDVKPLEAALRVTKDAGELALIQKAIDASIASHFAAMHAMKPGMTEREISALMQYEFGKRGCERPAYSPIVGAGFNSTVLHYSDDSGPIADGDVVVLDVAGEYSMYASDITRTLPANGKFTPRQREIYDIVLGAQRAAVAAFQSGKSSLGRTSADSLYKVAFDYINTHGKDRAGQPLGRYFIHGLGHYVGLNVHDVGPVNAPLGPGAIFTIEPGIYIPEEKLGVRIEDMFYVAADGKLIQLTAKLPQTAEDVEREMAAH